MRNKIFLAIAATVSIFCSCNKPVTNPETPDDPITPPAQAQAVYVKGFRIESIYLTNLFYRVELTGSTKMGGDTKLAKTDYSSIKLNKTNIPYVMFLSSPAKIGDTPDPFDWYSTLQITAYAAANTTASGAPCLDVTIPASVLSDKTEHTATSENGTRVTIMFEYK